MPSSAVRTFTDPDEYAAAIRQGTIELSVAGRGRFTANLTRIDLHRLWLQQFSENLPGVTHVQGWGGRAVFAFRSQPGPNLIRAGVEMHRANLLRHSPGQSYFHYSSGPANSAAMSVPLEDIAALGAVMAEGDPTPPKHPLGVTPPPAALARLQRLHAAAGRLAVENPEIIADPDAARGLEQALIEALVDCLGHGQEQRNSLAQGQHAIVMRRFRRVLEEHPEEPFYIPEICTAIGVPERTLRLCCQEHLGMAPKRYLVLRRLHQTRRALQRAAPDQATVTELAMRCGFWQLGRFAVAYRALFGEPPSATLRRPFDIPPPAFAEIA